MGLMDGYYVLGVIAISHLEFGVIINIVLKEDNSSHVTIGENPHYGSHDFNNIVLSSFEKKGNWVYRKHVYYMFKFISKVDNKNYKFNHTSTYIYDKIV